MKRFLTLCLIAWAFALFASDKSEAGDFYRILNADSLITARRADLVTFMYLNAQGNKPAVRALYNQLEAEGLLVNMQPGAIVKVTRYYDDGTAQIQANRLIGYIAKEDLSEYVGKDGESRWRQVQDNQ